MLSADDENVLAIYRQKAAGQAAGGAAPPSAAPGRPEAPK